MCTLILLRRPGHDWPLLLAANRDEMTDRMWYPPARHWPEYPRVVAGLDRIGGGSWLGMNDAGVLAAVMNRRGTLGPRTGKRSRGELVLSALAHEDATEAAAVLGDLDPARYRSFNLVVADRGTAFWICHRGDERHGGIEVHALPAGLTMLTNGDPNDTCTPRIRTFLPRFRSAQPPDPETVAGWSAWIGLLADRSFDKTAGPESAMNVVTASGYGTVSSALIALPAAARAELQPVCLFAAGRPDQAPFQPVRTSNTCRSGIWK